MIMREALIPLVMQLIDMIYYFIPSDFPSKKQLEDIQIISHRGAFEDASIKENTLRAIESAVNLGCEGVEIDIRWTKDLVPIIHHDPTLLRVFQKDVFISQLSFSELRQIEPEIPSLAEVVDRFGNKIKLYLELKEEYFPNLIKQKEILQQVLEKLKPKKDFYLMSLSMKTLEKFNLYDSKVYLSIARFDLTEKLKHSIEKDFNGVTGHYFLFKKHLLKKCENSQLVCGTGFPKSLNVFKREVNRGAKLIFTNHPAKLIHYRKQLLKNY